ncbi:hypothetical protein HNQ92_004488 [Rhabdobacter roseus]|uniref:Uncharacterized protein n=1 Tax=Rhabdobacter roseus TaxID=1655419 RepID=A0A840U1T5_9BACT|nr:hypothetical protein [Rhabdobacter roseus]
MFIEIIGIQNWQNPEWGDTMHYYRPIRGFKRGVLNRFIILTCLQYFYKKALYQ